MFMLPQEIDVWYVIPTIRKELAEVLVKKYHLSLEKAGTILGISKAAVSQYLSGKRAGKMTLDRTMKKEVKNSAEIIHSNPELALQEISKLINTMRAKKCSCEVCKKYNPEVIKLCKKQKC